MCEEDEDRNKRETLKTFLDA